MEVPEVLEEQPATTLARDVIRNCGLDKLNPRATTNGCPTRTLIAGKSTIDQTERLSAMIDCSPAIACDVVKERAIDEG